MDKAATYRRVIELRQKGLSYRGIIRAINAPYAVPLAKSTISDWVTGNHTPWGRVNFFSGEPFPELAYVIGVSRGDGSFDASKKGHYHKVVLEVKDRDFAGTFDDCLCTILRCEPHTI